MTEHDGAHPIVVGIDGSRSAVRAAQWAADEAVRRGAGIRLVSAVRRPPPGYQAVAPADLVEGITTQAHEAVASARRAILADHDGLTVDTEVRAESPTSALIEESRDARLLVLGSRGLGGITGMLVGSTAAALVAHAYCPVAVIRGEASDTGPVVVGVDGSPVSEAAVAFAFEEAALRGTDLKAVHAWLDYSSDVAYATARQFMVNWKVIERRETRLLTDQLEGWQSKYPGVNVRSVVVRDRPVHCLLDESAGAQLLVVGSRGRGGFTGLALGSTSQTLLHHATCPLIVARHT